MRVGTKRVEVLFNGAGWIHRGSILLCAFFLAFSGCTNIDQATRAPTSVVTLANGSGGSGLSTGAFRLDGITPDPDQSLNAYDLLGENGEFGSYCGGNYGTCVCRYTSDQPGIGTINQETSVTYAEENLVRCPNGVPAGVTTFTVTLVAGLATGTVYQSNALTASLGPGGTLQDSPNYIDLADEKNYLPVKRFQCRYNVYIANPVDSTMIDPVQSRDPRLLYPFNYYTTNVAASLLAMQQSAQSQGWECTLTPTPDRSLHWWSNPMVFSRSSCTSPFCIGDGEMIYPDSRIDSGRVPASIGSQATGKRRSSFTLLKQPYGVFQVPLVAATAPSTFTTSIFSVPAASPSPAAGTVQTPPLGYAANPIAGGACPSVKIPSNAHWVKLWSFTAHDLNPPTYVRSSTAATGGSFACPLMTMYDPAVAPSCSFPMDLFFGGNGVASNTTSSILAPGALGGSAPYFYQPNGALGIAPRVALFSGVDLNLSSCYRVNTLDDRFMPSNYAFAFGSVATTVDQMKMHPWEMYGNLGGASGVVTQSGLPGAPIMQYSTLARYILDSDWIGPAAKRPTDSAPGTISLSQNGSAAPTAFTDHLFVVTDPLVNTQEMEAAVNGSNGLDQYLPVTFRTRQSCPGSPWSSCAQYDRVTWDLDRKDVNVSFGSNVYPLCVLQFTD